MRNEKEFRRPEFQPGVPVILGDGQTWHFPRPTLRWKCVLDPQTRRPKSVAEYPAESPDYAEALEALDDGKAEDYLGTAADLAVQLLLRNYDLPDELIPELFWHEPASEVSQARWNAVQRAIRGFTPVPKAEPAG